MSQERNLPGEAQMHRAMNATAEQQAALRDLALNLGAAPELSETERARLDAIEAAEPAPESWFIRKLIAAELRAAADDSKMPRNGRNVCLRRADVLDPS